MIGGIFVKRRLWSFFFTLLLCACIGGTQQAAAASDDITITLDGVAVSLAVQPRYGQGQEIMVPLKALTDALGGVSTDISMGFFTYPAAALNERGIVLMTAADSYCTLPLAPEDLPFQDIEGMSFTFLRKLMEDMIYGGQIGIHTITFSYNEVSGDIYLPLRTYAQLFQLSCQVSGNTVDFQRDYIEYVQPAFREPAAVTQKQQVTFSVKLITKTYDGRPYSWDMNSLEAYCNGKKIDEDLALHFSYEDVGRGDGVLSDQLPTQAGLYHLVVSVDADDARYTGKTSIPFAISKSEIVLAAKDVHISAGDALPELPFEVRSLYDGAIVQGALSEQPSVSIRSGLTDTSAAGVYEIVVTGGVAADNYTIHERIAGKLTIAEPVQPEYPAERPADDPTDDRPAELPSGNPGSSISDQPPAAPVQHEAYITGYEDRTFRPEAPLTRGACAAMLYRIAEVSSSNTVSFTDVSSGAWYYEAVQALAGKGVIHGYEDHTFRADASVTRAEFLAMALRLLDVKPVSDGGSFSDISSSHWAADYIRTAAGQGIVSGYPGGTFRPDQTVTRAEAAKILNRITGRDTCKVGEYQTSFADVRPGYWAYDAIMRAANDHVHV